METLLPNAVLAEETLADVKKRAKLDDNHVEISEKSVALHVNCLNKLGRLKSLMILQSSDVNFHF